MNKNNLKNFMMVRDGLDNLFLVMINDKVNKRVMVRNYNEEEEANATDKELEEMLPMYEFDEFDDNLINIEKPVWSIVEVYNSLPIKMPFELNVEEMFNHYKPKLLWKREASPLSMSELKSFKTKKEQRNYVESIVPPYIIVA